MKEGTFFKWGLFVIGVYLVADGLNYLPSKASGTTPPDYTEALFGGIVLAMFFGVSAQ